MKDSEKVSLLDRIEKISKVVVVMLMALSTVLIYQAKSQQLTSLENQLMREESTLNVIYLSLDNSFSNANVSVNETKTMAKSAINALVCSEANYYNNKAHQAYSNFNAYMTEISEKMYSYREQYKKCVELIEEINELQKYLGIKQLSELSVISDREVMEREKSLTEEDIELVNCLSESQTYADTLYAEYYPLLLPLVTGEAGDYYYPDLDQFYIMNVAENRVKSKYFPNTIREVIFQPGQYQPTWDGSWNKKSDQRTKENVEKYLRGQVDTAMPDEVVYQAMFIQGDYVWKHVTNPVDIGHYYCAKKTA